MNSFMDVWRFFTGGAKQEKSGLFMDQTSQVSDNPGEAAANTMSSNLKPITDNIEGYSDEAKDSDALQILMGVYSSFGDLYSSASKVREENAISHNGHAGSMTRRFNRGLAQLMQERGAFDDQHPNRRLEATLPEYTEEMMQADLEMSQLIQSAQAAKNYTPGYGLLSSDEMRAEVERVRNLPVNQVERPTIESGPPEDDEGNPIPLEEYVPDGPYAQFLKDVAEGVYDGPFTGRLFSEDVERIEAQQQQPDVKAEAQPLQPGANVDFGFIAGLEGGNRLDMYIPRNAAGQISGDSGATVGTGIDVGQMRERDLRGLPEALKTKLKPYLNKTGQAAQTFLTANPLSLTEEETTTLNAFVKDRIITTLIRKFDAASETSFSELTAPQATALMSVAFQYGSNKPTETYPTFWKAVTEGDWTAAEAELRDFKDAYASRRLQEADLLAGK